MQLTILFLTEFIVFFSLWLFDDYVGTMLSINFSLISLFILIIALIAEWLDRSKVPRLYFGFMLVSVFTPLIASATYIAMFGTELGWLKF